MKKCVLVVCASLLALFAGQTLAAESETKVEITWENPKEYTDVRPSNESRSRFRERTLNSLEEYIVELAEDLPEGQTLQMTVTDLDLAGQVWPSNFVGLGTGGMDVRLIKRIDIPRMEFSYSLMDADGNVLKTEQVNLKDMAFQDRFNPLFNSDSYRYEKNMIREWFDDTFGEKNENS